MELHRLTCAQHFQRPARRRLAGPASAPRRRERAAPRRGRWTGRHPRSRPGHDARAAFMPTATGSPSAPLRGGLRRADPLCAATAAEAADLGRDTGRDSPRLPGRRTLPRRGRHLDHGHHPSCAARESLALAGPDGTRPRRLVQLGSPGPLRSTQCGPHRAPASARRFRRRRTRPRCPAGGSP